MYEVIIEHPVERFIKGLKESEQKRILDAIGRLEDNPRLGKKLVGKLAGLRSLHESAYRVIYKVEDVKLIVLILRAGHRRDVYNK